MYLLRYYAHLIQEFDEKVTKLLKEIKTKHGIEYEIFDLKTSNESLVFEQHFKSRNRILSKRVGGGASANLKTGSGHFRIGGMVAIVKDVVKLNGTRDGVWRN